MPENLSFTTTIAPKTHPIVEPPPPMQPNSTLRVYDVFVFMGLESLGTLAIMGNLFLIVVLLRNRYLHRASFILMLSLACADVLHGLVTTCFFYPPIVLKQIAMPHIGIRVFNIIDWTAWSITLTHMSAICLDRCIAIMLYSSYNQIVTVKRIRTFSISCWAFFLALNTSYFAFNFCCLIAPLSGSSFYTFGYDDELKSTKKLLRHQILDLTSTSFTGNAYVYTYTPLEVITLCILSVSNPITLVQLYRRHKRKVAMRIVQRGRSQAPQGKGNSNRQSLKAARSQWQRASTMLLEMSIRMGSKHYQNDVREVAARRANRQQQRILLQISVVAAIFYSYMTAYYLIYHVLQVESKWVMLFNSFFYSTTHMINPVIYFSLNKEMRAQLVRALSDLLNFVCCIQTKEGNETFGGSMIRHSLERKTSHKINQSFCTATETSPLFSHANRKKNAAKVVAQLKKDSFTSSLNHLVESAQNTNTSSDHSTVIVSSVEKPMPSPVEQPTKPKISAVTAGLHQIPQTIITPDKEEVRIIEKKTAEEPALRKASMEQNSRKISLEHAVPRKPSTENAEEQLRKAKEARRTLLEALIRALDVFSEDESEIEEIKSKINKPSLVGQYKTFGQSKSFDSPSKHKNGDLKTSKTLHQVMVSSSETPSTSKNSHAVVKKKVSLKLDYSPDTTSSSEQPSSNSERYNQLTKTDEWQKWKESKSSQQRVEILRESLTMLIDNETNVESDYDEDDVIYL